MKKCFLVEVNLEDPAKIEISEGHTWEDYLTKAIYFEKNGIVISVRGHNKKVFFDRREAKEWGLSVINEKISSLESTLIQLKNFILSNL